ncbi:uncharacterized protein LOC129000305 [Macrosteles quadrilineatus]|uniref:uncharacterized protein LOC129000305 n=1 Tax=Macrosteles quadrilineatus TaxID=74068 RepID=UPI0023E0ABE7|nr:uncharacterized protein LOC129000305 [Macrosteles quadrilineatus]
MSDLLYVCFVLCVSVGGTKADDSKTEDYNPFDKFFPHLTTEKDELPMYRVYRWRNHPTTYTNRPPPRRRGEVTTETPTTEEPEDSRGDFIFVPDATPVSDGHPFLDKFGKRPSKIY